MVAPGEGRSIFGPPVDPFLPAMLSSEENGESGPRCQPGLAKLCAIRANAVFTVHRHGGFVSPTWSLSRLTGTTSLRSVADGESWAGIGNSGAGVLNSGLGKTAQSTLNF